MPKKNPRIEAHLAPLRTQLQQERDAVLADLAPLYAQRDALQAQIEPLHAQLREVQAQIKPAEAPLREIGNQLAQIERTIGSTSLTLEAAATTATPGEVG
jgi:uncharacterized coiled-coil DUF342 family protein